MQCEDQLQPRILYAIGHNMHHIIHIGVQYPGREKPGTWHLAPWYPQIVVLAPLKSGIAQEIMLH